MKHSSASHHRRRGVRWAVWLWLLVSACGIVRAQDFPDVDRYPLSSVDTSSPRATLHSFIDFMNRSYADGYMVVRAYLASPRLFPTPEEMATIRLGQNMLRLAERALDFSSLPPATVTQSAHRLTIQLKEVLDRIPIPPFESIPDAAAMANAEFKRWTLPGTEIRIKRIETGIRAGEYLFGPETVSRIPEFYERIEHLPYKPGSSEGLYGLTAYSPTGLALALEPWVPPRWFLALPEWALSPFLEQPLWRWAGIVVVLGIGLMFFRLSYRLRHRWRHAGGRGANWSSLLRPITLMLVTPAAAVVLDEVFKVSGFVGKALTLSLWTLFFLGATWLVWVLGSAIAEGVIAVERLRSSSIDSQLIRLGLRLLTIIAAIAILIVGADQIGLPAYSVVAGLGVGGLAVALAGQQTLANLLGSVIIMLEKPFSIGQWIKVDGVEGTVEDVGFRSTRIRTAYDSLVTIPSSELVSSTIDNHDRRRHREVKTVLGLTYDTTPEQLETFVAGVRQLLQEHPGVRKDSVQVAFFDYGPNSLDVLVKFLVRAPDRAAELAERQQVLLAILRLAETHGVRFAFPTQTLHVESLPSEAGRRPPS
ncbi:mechanosensitive ion channel family protein [Methylolobus aquaticus]